MFYTHSHRHYFIHVRLSREMQEIFRRANNNKRQNFIEPFLIRSVCCKRDHFLRSFQSSPLVLSRLNTAAIRFLSGSGSRYAIQFLIWGCITLILAPNITTRWYLKLLGVAESALVWMDRLLCFSSSLARWRNCDVGLMWPWLPVIGLAVCHSENNRPIRREAHEY